MADRLYRSTDDRMIAGVAGGVAERLEADPSIIRIVWALLIVLTGGIALVAYIVMAIVVPDAPDGLDAPGDVADPGGPALGSESGADPVDPDDPTAATSAAWIAPSGQPVARASGTGPSRRRARSGERDRNGAMIGGLILILIGAFFLVRQFLPAIDLGSWWPLILVGIGAILVVSAIGPGRKPG